MHALVFYLSFFPLLPYISASTKNPQPYTPTDYILINCGSTSNSTSIDGRIWEDDDSKFSSPHTGNESLASTDDPYATQVPYTTARIFHSTSTYSFTVSTGPKFIRLYFHPATYAGLDKTTSYFSVTSNGFTLLTNFSTFLTVSAMGSSVVRKEFVINVQNNQRLNITFIPFPNSYAFINGIEVVSVPNNLYHDRGKDDAVKFVGFNGTFDNTTALETVYRVNVGGDYISDEFDTGMFRMWEEDVMYIFGAAVGLTSYLSNIKIQYTEDTPAFTAPEIVYTSSRTMGRNPNINLNYNITWLFPVDVGFLYLVRLHFCETMLEVTRENQRVFTIFINNQTAEEEADVIRWAGGSNLPVYKDYIVRVPNERPGNKQDLWLQLHPDISSKPKYADAILNGLEIFKLNRSDASLAGFNPDPVPITSSIKTQVRPLTKPKYSRKTAITIIGGAISAVALVISITGMVAFRVISKRVKDVESTGVASRWGLLPFTGTKLTQKQGSSSLHSEFCRQFSLAEIRTATNDFDDVLILGVGGFGNVYKGFISGGVNPVAIKRLNPGSKQGAHEFHAEINMLSQLHYLNLVSLIGYCNDDDEMILVYDYMARGTLRDHLYNTDNPPLPWKKRLEICIGAARALNYLHTGAKQTVIHRDVKTTNILLDEKWVAKLSDFGLSKIGPHGSHVTTVVKGSFGYLDPEYYLRQQLTEKSDVYSFGVVLCEVLCARPPIMHDIAETAIGLARWVQEGYGKGEVEQMVDPFLKGKIGKRCLKKFVEIAVSCLLDSGIERPSMNEVLWGLEFALQLQESVDKDVGLVVVEAEALMDDEKALFPISTLDGSDDMLGSRSGQLSSTNSISRVTIMREQSFESDQDSGKWLANVLSGSKIVLSDCES